MTLPVSVLLGAIAAFFVDDASAQAPPPGPSHNLTTIREAQKLDGQLGLARTIRKLCPDCANVENAAGTDIAWVDVAVGANHRLVLVKGACGLPANLVEDSQDLDASVRVLHVVLNLATKDYDDNAPANCEAELLRYRVTVLHALVAKLRKRGGP